MARADMQTYDLVVIGGAAGGGRISADDLFQLGIRHSIGHEAPVDVVSAHKWFNLAALCGNAAAKDYRAELAHEMSKTQVAQAQKLAREWLRSH